MAEIGFVFWGLLLGGDQVVVVQGLFLVDLVGRLFVVGDRGELHWGFSMFFGLLVALCGHSDVMLQRVPVLVFFPELDDFVDVFHMVSDEY